MSFSFYQLFLKQNLTGLLTYCLSERCSDCPCYVFMGMAVLNGLLEVLIIMPLWKTLISFWPDEVSHIIIIFFFFYSFSAWCLLFGAGRITVSQASPLLVEAGSSLLHLVDSFILVLPAYSTLFKAFGMYLLFTERVGASNLGLSPAGLGRPSGTFSFNPLFMPGSQTPYFARCPFPGPRNRNKGLSIWT